MEAVIHAPAHARALAVLQVGVAIRDFLRLPSMALLCLGAAEGCVGVFNRALERSGRVVLEEVHAHPAVLRTLDFDEGVHDVRIPQGPRFGVFEGGAEDASDGVSASKERRTQGCCTCIMHC